MSRIPLFVLFVLFVFVFQFPPHVSRMITRPCFAAWRMTRFQHFALPRITRLIVAKTDGASQATFGNSAEKNGKYPEKTGDFNCSAEYPRSLTLAL